jgi:hypothetical protein
VRRHVKLERVLTEIHPIESVLKVLEEDTREQLLKDADLRSELKAKRVMSQLVLVKGSQKTLIYRSKSDESPKHWTQLIRANIQPRMTMFGIKKAINQGDLLVHCDCPAFKWWGYNYIITSRRAIYPGKELTIYPKIRNPRLVGTVCKHLIQVLAKMPQDDKAIYKELNKPGRDD